MSVSDEISQAEKAAEALERRIEDMEREHKEQIAVIQKDIARVRQLRCQVTLEGSLRRAGVQPRIVKMLAAHLAPRVYIDDNDDAAVFGVNGSSVDQVVAEYLATEGKVFRAKVQRGPGRFELELASLNGSSRLH
jgi:hypothetical protein